jgi:hypothetical protein
MPTKRTTNVPCAKCGRNRITYDLPSRIAKKKLQLCRYCRHYGSNSTPLASRFWATVNKNGPVPAHRPELGPCWVRPGRYGGMLYVSTKIMSRAAHRVAFFLKWGRWPEPCCLHKCDNGPIGCVRWDHLFEGTFSDNVQDMIAKGRQNVPDVSLCSLRTHCPKGHPYAGENLFVRTTGSRAGRRECKSCRRDYDRRRYVPKTDRPKRYRVTEPS